MQVWQGEFGATYSVVVSVREDGQEMDKVSYKMPSYFSTQLPYAFGLILMMPQKYIIRWQMPRCFEH